MQPLHEGNQDEVPTHRDEEQIVQELKERKEKIKSLEGKLEEALRAIAVLTEQTERPTDQDTVKEPTPPKRSTAEGIDDPSADQIKEHISTQSRLDEMIQQHITAAMAKSQVTKGNRKERPYPAEYELIPYPDEFTSPDFELFDGIGNPKQHVAHFRAQCCHLGGIDALLLRQFVASLTGIAFEWYSGLPNNMLTTFDEMEDVFVNRFMTAQRQITLVDLIQEQKNPNESLPDYIIRWRSLSMQCEPQIAEKYAVDLLLENIKGPISPLLMSSDIDTFQVLLNKVARILLVLNESAHQIRGEEKTFRNKPNKRKEAGIAQITNERKKKRALITTPQQAGSKKAALQEKQNKKYSFTKESTRQLFYYMIRAGMILPNPRFPHETGLTDNPKFCHYHRCLGHTIEDCYIFKDMIEEEYQKGNVSIPERFLLSEASIHAISYVGQTSQPIPRASKPC